MSQEKFGLIHWLGLAGLPFLIYGLGASFCSDLQERDEQLRKYQTKAQACASGIQRALDAAKAKGYHNYPTEGAPGNDTQLAYYRRYSQLQSDKSNLLTEDTVARLRSLVMADDCRYVESGMEVSIEPTYEQRTGLNFDQSVAKARDDAARSNAQADKAMDDMLEGYRKKAVSAKTVPSSGSRVDLFEMPDGTIVTCRTSFRNGARATSCS